MRGDMGSGTICGVLEPECPAMPSATRILSQVEHGDSDSTQLLQPGDDNR